MRVSGFLSLLFFCDAYEFSTNFRVKELPIKLFLYNFVRPDKSCETRRIIVAKSSLFCVERASVLIWGYRGPFLFLGVAGGEE